MLNKQKDGQSHSKVVCQTRCELNPACCSKRNVLAFAKPFKPPLIGPQKDFCTQALGHGIPVPNCELGKPVTFIYPKSIFYGIEPAKKPGSSPQLKNWKKWCTVWNSNQSATRGKNNIPPAIMTSGEGWRRKLEDVDLLGRTLHNHHMDGFHAQNIIYPDTIGPDKECSPGIQETLLPRYYKKFPPMERIRIPKTIRKEMHLPLRHASHDATSEQNEQYWKWEQNWKNSEYLQETKMKLCEDIYRQGPVPPCPDRLIIKGKNISRDKRSRSDELGLPYPIPELIFTMDSEGPSQQPTTKEPEPEVPPFGDNKRGPVLFIEGRTFQVLLKKNVHMESDVTSTLRENQFLYDSIDGFAATTKCKEVRHIKLENQGTTTIRYQWVRSPPNPATRNLLGNPGKMLHLRESKNEGLSGVIQPNELDESGDGIKSSNKTSVHLTSSRNVDPGLTRALKLMRNCATAESSYENLLLMLAFRVPRLKRLLVRRTGKQLTRRQLPGHIQQFYLKQKEKQRVVRKMKQVEGELNCTDEYEEGKDFGEADVSDGYKKLCPCQISPASNNRNDHGINECHCADPTPKSDLEPRIQTGSYGCDYMSKEGLPSLTYDFETKDHIPTRLPPSGSMTECQEQLLRNSEQKQNTEEETKTCDFLSNEGLTSLYDYESKEFIPTRLSPSASMTECQEQLLSNSEQKQNLQNTEEETKSCDYMSNQGLTNLTYDYETKDYIPTRLPPSASMTECQDQHRSNSERKQSTEEETISCDYLSKEGLSGLTYDYETKDFLPTRTQLDPTMVECNAREGVMEIPDEKRGSPYFNYEQIECKGEREENLEGVVPEGATSFYDSSQVNETCIPKTQYISEVKKSIDSWIKGQRVSLDESGQKSLQPFISDAYPDDQIFRELKGYEVTRDYDPNEMKVEVDVWLDKKQGLGFDDDYAGEPGENEGVGISNSRVIPLHPTQGTYELNTQTLSQNEIKQLGMDEFPGEGETEGRKYSSTHSPILGQSLPEKDNVGAILKDPCFDFHFRELPGVLLPGQSAKFPIIFRPRQPGLYYETLYLVTHPRLCEATYAIRLNGICTDPELPQKSKTSTQTSEGKKTLWKTKLENVESEMREQMLKKQGRDLLDSVLDNVFYLAETFKTTLPFGKVTKESIFYAHNPALYYHHGTAERALKIMQDVVSQVVPEERTLKNDTCPLNIENLYRELTKPNLEYHWSNLKNDEAEELLKEFNQCTKLLIKPNAMNTPSMTSQKFNATFHSLATVISEITFDLVGVEQSYNTPELVNVLQSNILDRIKRYEAKEARKKQQREESHARSLFDEDEEDQEDGEIVYRSNQVHAETQKDLDNPEIPVEVQRTVSKISEGKGKSPRSGKKGKPKSQGSKSDKRKHKDVTGQESSDIREDFDESENEGGENNLDKTDYQDKMRDDSSRASQTDDLKIHRDYEKEVEKEFNRLQKLRQHQAKIIIFENVLAVGIERMMCVIDNMNHMHQYRPSDYVTPEHRQFYTC